jgi:hypothetical protein
VPATPNPGRVRSLQARLGEFPRRGAIVSTAQLVHVAPVLAQTMGIIVSDD